MLSASGRSLLTAFFYIRYRTYFHPKTIFLTTASRQTTPRTNFFVQKSSVVMCRVDSTSTSTSVFASLIIHLDVYCELLRGDVPRRLYIHVYICVRFTHHPPRRLLRTGLKLIAEKTLSEDFSPLLGLLGHPRSALFVTPPTQRDHTPPDKRHPRTPETMGSGRGQVT